MSTVFDVDFHAGRWGMDRCGSMREGGVGRMMRTMDRLAINSFTPTSIYL